jgi:hypothetical protein
MSQEKINSPEKSLAYDETVLSAVMSNIWEKHHLRSKPGAGSMAQVVECLPSKGEALSSNPQYDQNNNSINNSKNM